MSKLLVYISDFCICKTKKDIILKIINLSAIIIGLFQSIITFFISGLELKICTIVLAVILALVALINMAFFSDKKFKTILAEHTRSLAELRADLNILLSNSPSSSHIQVKFNNNQDLPNTKNYINSIHNNLPTIKI